MTPETNSSKHTLPTRLLHGALALAILVQLSSSLGMVPEEHDHAGNLLYGAHEVAGVASFDLVLAFWLWILVRRKCGALAALFPWLSAGRRRALVADIRLHLTQ